VPTAEPYTVVEYVVEFRLVHGDGWERFPADLSSSDEAYATKGYESLLASKRARGSGRVNYRMIKRTAVITDEVILEDTEQPEEP
jgi:hypothetical protein